jgi:hypothetical protein
MRPIPNWKWRQHPLVKIYGKYESLKHQLLKLCITDEQIDAVRDVMYYLTEHVSILYQTNAMSKEEVLNLLENIYYFELPEEFLGLKVYKFTKRGIDDNVRRIWDSLMFEARISKHYD